MAFEPEELRAKCREAQQAGATHVVLAHDFNDGDQAVFVEPGENWLEVKANIEADEMKVYMGDIDLSRDVEQQIAGLPHE